MEIQTRLKFGFESRFGRVEDVYPASSAHDRAFIVKFLDEVSVQAALASGGGRMEEKELTVDISAVYRSKWMNMPYGKRPRDYNMANDSYRAGHMAGGHGMLPHFAHGQQYAMPVHLGNANAAVPYGHYMYANPQHAYQFDHRFQHNGYYPTSDATGVNRSPFFQRPQLERQNLGDTAAAKPFVPQANNQPLVTKNDGNVLEGQNKAGADVQSKQPAEQAIGNENIPPASSAAKVILPGQLPTNANAPLTGGAACKSQETTQAEAGVSQIQREKSPMRPPKKGRKPKGSNKTAPQCDTAEKSQQLSKIGGEAQNQTPVASSASQAPSKPAPVFTEDEIRGRKQAWDRIPMPLDPRRKASGAASTSSTGTAAAGHDRAQSLPSVSTGMVPEPEEAGAAAFEAESGATSPNKNAGGKGKAKKAKPNQSQGQNEQVGGLPK